MRFARMCAGLGALVAATLMWAAPAAAAPVFGQGTWETTLKGRDINGNAVAGSSAGAVFLYDSVLNITWLRDASANGGMNDWAAVNSWASGLNVGGFTGWRLPTMVDTGAPGCNFAYTGTDCGYNVQTKVGSTVYSEMAHLYYVTLGNKSYFDTSGNVQSGSGLTNTGDFQNMQADYYWSGTEYAPSPSLAWFFNIGYGSQFNEYKGYYLYALAVRSGDVVAEVPEPESLALVLVGLAAAGLARRRRPL